MTTAHRAIPLIAATWLAACQTLFATPTPTATPPPTLTPTPAPAVAPDRVWLAPDGLSDSVTAAGADGVSLSIRLPLNNEQRASETVASPDGRYLAYLVWNDADEQHGLASWPLAEPNARLIYQPLSGYRIVSLWPAGDSETLLFVEQEQNKRPDLADWRLQSIPLNGGSPALLVSAETQPDLLPPDPFGLLPDGAVIFNANTRYDVDSGKPLQADFAAGVDGTLRQVSLPDDRVVGDGALSPDGAKLAYTTIPGALPGQPGDAASGSGANVVRVVTLATGQAATIKPSEGMTIASLVWMPDSARLLLDLAVKGQGGQTAQAWQIVTPGAETQPSPSSADLARARLFTYLPLGDKGVVYSLFPADDDTDWKMFLLADITADGQAKSITLGRLDPAIGPPRVIHAP